MVLCRGGTAITLNGAQLFQYWPPHWGPHSKQLHRNPFYSQAERTVFAHSPASVGVGCVSVCIFLSLPPERRNISFSPSQRVKHFSSSSVKPTLFRSHPQLAPFQKQPLGNRPPSEIVFHLLGNNRSVLSPPPFPPSELRGSSVCGPGFELSTSKCFHVAPCAHTHPKSQVTKGMLLLEPCNSRVWHSMGRGPTTKHASLTSFNYFCFALTVRICSFPLLRGQVKVWGHLLGAK